MSLTKYVPLELTFFVCFVLWKHLLISAEELCVPGGTQIFTWNYESDATRLETSWYCNGTEIMQKIISDEILINPNTQFAKRIWEYNGTNCGLIIFDVKNNDTGTFEVIVKFNDGTEHTAKETLFITVDAGESEVQENAEILINKAPHKDPDDNYLGEPPLNFTFNLTKACIPAPVIRIIYNKTEVEACVSEYSCSYRFPDPGEVVLNITVGAEDIPYPPNGENPFIIGFNKTDSSEESKELSCREKIECIVPATVVPIGCVLIVVITTLAIKRPCRN